MPYLADFDDLRYICYNEIIKGVNKMKKESFEYANLLKIKKMSLEELNSYYRALRKYEFESGKNMSSSTIIKRIHFLKMLILKIDRILTKRELIVFDDKRENSYSNGKIYAASHVGRYDIESTLEAINDPAYFVMGDPEETYRNFEGFFLDKINGRICFDTGYQTFDAHMAQKSGKVITEQEKKSIEGYKIDRAIGEKNCIKRVQNGDNILIYPEGAWNITDRLTQTLFPGTARIAINGNGIIIPIGIIRNDKTYIVNIGRELDVTGANLTDVANITLELKELLNSLKGEIIFHDLSKIIPRSTFKSPEENIKHNIDDIMSESTNGYTIDVIEKTRYFDLNYPENVIGNTLTKKLH